MSRKITKKMLLNLYQDRVELEDDLRERDRQEHLESCARADDRKDKLIEAIKEVAPQVLTLAMQSYSRSSSSFGSVGSPSLAPPSESDLVDRIFESLEASPEMLQNIVKGMDASTLASFGELHGRVAERRGHFRTPAPVPVGVWAAASPTAPLVGGLVAPYDLQKVAPSSGGKLAWMLQNLTASELESLAEINDLVQSRAVQSRAANAAPHGEAS